MNKSGQGHDDHGGNEMVRGCGNLIGPCTPPSWLLWPARSGDDVHVLDLDDLRKLKDHLEQLALEKLSKEGLELGKKIKN